MAQDPQVADWLARRTSRWAGGAEWKSLER